MQTLIASVDEGSSRVGLLDTRLCFTIVTFSSRSQPSYGMAVELVMGYVVLPLSALHDKGSLRTP